MPVCTLSSKRKGHYFKCSQRLPSILRRHTSHCVKQESVEELMDFFQATKRYHLSKRFGHREYLVQSLQAVETRVQGLLSTAAAQLTSLIHKHER